MRYYLGIHSKNRVPWGSVTMRRQYGSWWIVGMLAGRTSPRHTGRKLLRLCQKLAKKKGMKSLRLGTNYDNQAMLRCALHSGFTLAGTNKNGYVLEWLPSVT